MGDQGEVHIVDYSYDEEEDSIGGTISKAYDQRVRASLFKLDSMMRDYKTIPHANGNHRGSLEDIRDYLDRKDFTVIDAATTGIASLFAFIGSALSFDSKPYREIFNKKRKRREYASMRMKFIRAINLADGIVNESDARNSRVHRYHVVCASEIPRLGYLRQVLARDNEQICRDIDSVQYILDHDLESLLTVGATPEPAQMPLPFNTPITKEQVESFFDDTVDLNNVCPAARKDLLFDAVLRKRTLLERNQHDIRVIDRVIPIYVSTAKFISEQYEQSEAEVQFAREYRTAISMISLEMLYSYARNNFAGSVSDIRSLAHTLNEGFKGRYLPSAENWPDEEDPVQAILSSIEERLEYRRDYRDAFGHRRVYDALEAYRQKKEEETPEQPKLPGIDDK